MNAPSRLPAPAQGGAIFALTTKLASHFDMVNIDPQELIDTLKATAFKVPGQNAPVVNDAQLTALLIVANEYRLNPWTKEIYAFPAKGGGIVPIVGVDGWLNIINNHPQFDGMEFEWQIEGDRATWSCTCIIYRKDRSRPTKVTEFLEECFRDTDPWKQMTRRMMRNKAIIQCGRVAFSYGGIHDPDEGEQIAEKFMGPAEVVQPGSGAPAAGAASTEQGQTTVELPKMTTDDLAKRESKVAEFYSKGKTADEIVAFYGQKFTVTDAIKKAIRELQPKAGDPAGAEQKVTDVEPKANQDTGAPKVSQASVVDKIVKAADLDQLAEAETLIPAIENTELRKEAAVKAEERRAELTKEA